ncbi:MAG: glycosyltransferase family 2 protein [Bacteroidetes bacterium]|nr:glycosyltransferase family 2 protein [Bacteroidota bacterium]
MKEPLVSVVMAAYNAEKYLKEAVNSVLNQSYSNIELVIVNDGSTDSTKDIILSYSDKRIKYVENEMNSGLVVTRNKGLENASGEYIAILDSDDIAMPDKIQKQVSFLEVNKNYGLCATFFRKIDGEGKIVSDITIPVSNKDLQTFLHYDNCICHSTVMARAGLLKQLRYSEGSDIIEDTDLLHRLAKITKMATLPVFTTLYRIHGTNISIAKKEKMFALMRGLNREKLNDMHVPFSDEELGIHSNAIVYEDFFFNSAEKMSRLERWILKLYRHCSLNKEYNREIMYKILVERWVVICSKRKAYFKMFFNKIIFVRPVDYLTILYKKITNQVINY